MVEGVPCHQYGAHMWSSQRDHTPVPSAPPGGHNGLHGYATGFEVGLYRMGVGVLRGWLCSSKVSLEVLGCLALGMNCKVSGVVGLCVSR